MSRLVLAPVRTPGRNARLDGIWAARHDYIERAKNLTACVHLRAGQPIEVVVLRLGLQTRSEFLRWFKAVNGMTPTEFILSRLHANGDVAEL